MLLLVAMILLLLVVVVVGGANWFGGTKARSAAWENDRRAKWNRE